MFPDFGHAVQLDAHCASNAVFVGSNPIVASNISEKYMTDPVYDSYGGIGPGRC